MMMLGFYGVRLDADNTLHRSDNYEERFDNLKRSNLFADFFVFYSELIGFV